MRSAHGDGSGGPLQHKTLARPGPVPLRDAQGRIRLDENGEPLMDDDDVDRWLASQWVQVNNKGNPVRASSRSSATPTASSPA